MNWDQETTALLEINIKLRFLRKTENTQVTLTFLNSDLNQLGSQLPKTGKIRSSIHLKELYWAVFSDQKGLRPAFVRLKQSQKSNE